MPQDIPARAARLAALGLRLAPSTERPGSGADARQDPQNHAAALKELADVGGIYGADGWGELKLYP